MVSTGPLNDRGAMLFFVACRFGAPQQATPPRPKPRPLQNPGPSR